LTHRNAPGRSVCSRRDRYLSDRPGPRHQPASARNALTSAANRLWRWKRKLVADPPQGRAKVGLDLVLDGLERMA
jgi:hypothetical protein